jgi:hypothetical protein
MLQSLLGLNNGGNRLVFGATLHLSPEARRDVDIANRHLLESHDEDASSNYSIA